MNDRQPQKHSWGRSRCTLIFYHHQQQRLGSYHSVLQHQGLSPGKPGWRSVLVFLSIFHSLQETFGSDCVPKACCQNHRFYLNKRNEVRRNYKNFPWKTCRDSSCLWLSLLLLFLYFCPYHPGSLLIFQLNLYAFYTCWYYFLKLRVMCIYMYNEQMSNVLLVLRGVVTE